MDKGLKDYVSGEQPDVLCLQETKAESSQVDTQWAEALGYEMHWNSAVKRGYSGTSIWTKVSPAKVTAGIGIDEHDQEGRVLTAKFGAFHLVTVYTPNSQRELARLDYRMQWDKDFLAYLKKLKRRGGVVFCGDLNCAHHEIDLANPKSNKRNAGFTEEERAGLDQVEASGFVDTFRHFSDEPEQYTWWTYRSNARERNIGWRLDYFWASKKLMPHIKSARIRSDIMGSDHCPVEIEIESPESA